MTSKRIYYSVKKFEDLPIESQKILIKNKEFNELMRYSLLKEIELNHILTQNLTPEEKRILSGKMFLSKIEGLTLN